MMAIGQSQIFFRIQIFDNHVQLMGNERKVLRLRTKIRTKSIFALIY